MPDADRWSKIMKTQTTELASHALGRFLIILSAALAGLTVLAPAAEAGQATNYRLNFATLGQPLFGGDGSVEELIDVDLVFFEEHIAPTVKGQIKRVPEELPVSTLQVIWQRAIDTCLAQSYTVPVIGTKISPTLSECVTGNISRKYCVAPPQLGWPDFGQPIHCSFHQILSMRLSWQPQSLTATL
jgi:hypothetical protein